MITFPWALLPLASVLAPSSGTELELHKVVSEARGDIARAQLPLKPLQPLEDGVHLGSLPSPSGDLAMTLRGDPMDVTGSQPEQLWVDLNGDGQEQPREVLALTPRTAEDPYAMTSLQPLGLNLELMVYENAGLFRATAMTQYHWQADITFEGEPQRAIFLDSNLDGRVSPGDRWCALTREQQAFLRMTSLHFLGHEVQEPWYGEERCLNLRIAKDGKVFYSEAEPIQSRSDFLRQRARAKAASILQSFEQDKAAFCERYEIDQDRARDPQPPQWYYARHLAEAMDYAVKEGRPLLVEFTSDGCPWCKRYDWLNYQDAEITPWLRRFTLVKIYSELDPDQTADSLDLQGFPHHALFDAEGQALRTATGWTPPRAHRVELEAFWEAWKAQELE